MLPAILAMVKSGAAVANEEQVKMLKQGIEVWNKWRVKNRDVPIDLSGARLAAEQVGGAILNGANLFAARFTSSYMVLVDLRDANLCNAELVASNLTFANLRGANLSGAYLAYANLTAADLTGANLTKANLGNTVFGTLDLGGIVGLETCVHDGPSIVDLPTLQKSGPLPIEFLRGVGLPERLIEYLPSLLNEAIQYYSCFISYSAKDQEFAERLHADLQNKGVRCWFAPHDMPIGGRLRDEIETAIRMRDKVVLILSKHSIKSDWVENEVETAFEEERKHDKTVLFPIRLDDMVMDTSEAWAATLRRQRHIGDFTCWKDHDAYKKSFERVLRDLKANKKSVG